ncbi:MAG: CHAT domain-containing tetratricopeptide repeat protein [Myxococcota bacterium]
MVGGLLGMVMAAMAATPADLDRALDDVGPRWAGSLPDSIEELDGWYETAFATADDPASTAYVRWSIAESSRAVGMSQFALWQYEQGLVGLRSASDEGREAPRWSPKAFAGRRGTLFEPSFVEPQWRSDWITTPDGARALEVALLVGAGNLYLVQNQLSVARPLFEEAVRIADGLGEPALRGNARTGLAWLALQEGKEELAVELLEAVPTMERRFRVPLRGAWLAAAAARLRSGDVKRARGWLEEADALYARAADRSGRATVWVLQGELYEALGRPSKALGRYTDAEGQAMVGSAAAWAAPLGLARLHTRQGAPQDALAAYGRYLQAIEGAARGFRTDQGQFSTLEAHADHLDAMVAVALELGEPGLVHRVVARARRRSLPALTARTDSIQPMPPGVLQPGRLSGETDDVPMMVQMAASTPLALVPVERDLGERQGTDPFAMVAPPADTWTLSTYALPTELLVTLREPSGAVHLGRSRMERDALVKKVENFRRALGADGDRVRGLDRSPPSGAGPQQALARDLYAIVVAPVAKHLPGDTDAPLLVVPDAALWSLPFAAMQDAKGGWFGQRALHFGVSEGAVGTSGRRTRPPRFGVLVVGNPGEDRATLCGRTRRLTALQGAEAEARAIADLDGFAKVDVLIGDQADALRLDAWHGSYGVLHFATHGFVCDDAPLDSLVQIGRTPPNVWNQAPDGTVSRRDDPRLVVKEMGQNDRFLPRQWQPTLPSVLTARHVLDHWHLNADLVALSACETGLGQSSHEGTIGLLRAFVASGARSVLVSLWPVDDATTTDLMVAFYKGYLAHGDKAVALRDAASQVRERHPEPRLWAPFVLVGPPQ